MPQTALAVIDDCARGEAFVQSILGWAERDDAHLIIDLLTPGPLAAAAFAPLGGMYLPQEMLKASAEEQVSTLKKIVAASKTPVEVRSLYDDVAWLAGDIRRAHPVADTALVGGRDTWAVPYLHRRVVETLTFGFGGPVVILPPGRSLTHVQHAVFGWKPGPEAARALHDLVALLSPGAMVDVIGCGTEPSQPDDPRGHRGVQSYLERCGFTVRSVWQARQSDVGHQLQTYTLEAGADLLAIGAFAHSRMRELVFGGVTENVIGDTRVPVLLSR